jgi:uncharacterized protein YqgC (DUF456 family)
MKTIEFSQRAILLASLLFLAGFVSLIFTDIPNEYVGIILICILVCLTVHTIDYEKKEWLQMFVFYGLAFAIYNLDTNLYIARFAGAKELLNCSGWMYSLGILLTGFVSLLGSGIIIFLCNPKLLYKKELVENK